MVFQIFYCTFAENDDGNTRRIMENYKKYVPIPIEEVLPMEVWLPVNDYEGLYEVSSWGRVRNYKTGSILKQRIDKYGYLRVHLCKNGKDKYPIVSRIVCKTFKSLPEEYHADHRNWVRDDNRFINIQPLPARNNIARVSEKGKTIKSYIGKVVGVSNFKKALSKPILQFDLEGNFINDWPSMMEAYRETKIPQTSISSCCRGLLKHAGGFIWRYAQ